MNNVRRSDTVNILLVEDNPGDARLVREALAEFGRTAFIVTHVDKLADARAAIANGHFDVAILDLGLPDSVGLETVSHIRLAAADMPIVVLTGSKDDRLGLEAIQSGAQDYYSKDEIRGSMLAPALRYAIERQRLINSLRQREAELERAQAALTESESLFRGSFMGAGHGMALLSLDRRFIRVNPALCRFLGYAEEELLGQTVGDVTHPDDLDRDRREWDGHIKEGDGVFSIEKRYIRKDRQVVWADLNVVLVRDANGRPKHCVSQALDITWRKRAEETLRHTNRALRVISRGNRALIHARDEEQLLRDMCRVVVQDGGYRRAWVAFADGDDVEETARQAAIAGHHNGDAGKTWADDRAGAVMTETALRDGRAAICSCAADDPRCGGSRDDPSDPGFRSCAAFPLKQGDRTFGVLNIHSSEADAFHEEERAILEESAADLAFGIVALRNDRHRKRVEAALAESESHLRQAEKMESLGNLAGGIAHDFNNMLLPIQSLTAMTLRDLPIDSPAARRLAKVVEASGRAGELVKRILTFSRRGETELQPMDVSDAINEALGLARSTLPSSVSIAATIEPDIGQVIGDRAQIQTALLNLAVNSTDAMEGKTGTLDVTLRRIGLDQPLACNAGILTPGDYAELTVADGGQGMDETTLQRIFEPFFTTKEVGHGTGLGLAMVHGIVTRHGGGVQVASTIGVGTTFTLYFPIARPI